MKRIYIVLAALLGACHSEAPPAAAPAAYAPHAQRQPSVQELTALGRAMFADASLSASGRVACASCHSPDNAFSPANTLAVQLAGADGKTEGTRAAPSLRYMQNLPPFSEHYHDDDGDDSVDAGPTGGHDWDGRASSAHEQALAPLLSPFEMANADPAAVMARLRASPSAAAFGKAFGEAALADVDVEAAFAKVLLALQSFQLEDTSFHPYNSKYDLYLYKRPGGELTAAEARGLKVFKDDRSGNCLGCHLSEASLDDGAPPQLTDYSFEAIGVPRNAQIPANRDEKLFDRADQFDVREDHVKFPEYCGLFKTPSLRNVATRRAFFHNGVIHSLEQAVRFYNTRDAFPRIWYPTVGGRPKAKPDDDFPRYGLITVEYVGGVVQKFDDLPPAHRKNLDKQLPLDGRAAGAKPPMTEQQVNDLVCFLETLTDDFVPGTPPAARCLN